MKRLRIIALFTAGLLLLIPALIVGWSGSAEPHFIQWLLVGLGVVLALMVALGVSARGRERWSAFGLVSMLLLGSSALFIFSLGLLIAPFALVLLAVSLWKLCPFHPSNRAKLNNASQ